MRIELNGLRIENFKGLKDFEMELEDSNAVITAENGIGKTTVYDAFLWLLFGKNSEGRKEFGVRPLDANNQPIKGLVVSVEAEINCDGTVHTLRKDHHEKVVKKQLRGYETLCWIDEVPKKIGEYQAYIKKLVEEDTFKLLTDLSYFNNKLTWEQRRTALLGLVGNDIGKPGGFDELLGQLNDRSIKDYKKVLSGEKKRHEDERDEINPRIDEIQKGFNGNSYVEDVDTQCISIERDKVKAEIIELDKPWQELFDGVKQRQEKIEIVNQLEQKKIQRAGELANDTTGIQNLLNEKKRTEINVGLDREIVGKARANLTTDQTLLNAAIKQRGITLSTVNAFREEHDAVKAASVDSICYACNQELPPSKQKENLKNRGEKLAEIRKQGDAAYAEFNNHKEEITKLEASLKSDALMLEHAEYMVKTSKQKRDKRFAEIDKLIATNETIPPESDKAWQVFDKQIKTIQSELGDPVSEQLAAIDSQKTEKQNVVEKLNQALAHADRMKQDKARIVELGNRETELAQLIADVEKQLAEIDEYNATESRMIEESVNGKFKHVEFKLFNYLLNESVTETCVAMFNGVPYSDMSTGQQIFCGVDIVNVLSKHYGISVPLFIDHAESFKMPVEAESQVIRLLAKSSYWETIILADGTTKRVFHDLSKLEVKIEEKAVAYGECADGREEDGGDTRLGRLGLME